MLPMESTSSAEIIARLTAERDEARRIACNQYAKRWSIDSYHERMLRKNFAEMHGWTLHHPKYEFKP